MDPGTPQPGWLPEVEAAPSKVDDLALDHAPGERARRRAALRALAAMIGEEVFY